jgi:hypothetical protein
MERFGPPEEVLSCPVCGQPTASLKQYRYVDWCVFVLAFAVWQAVYLRACPRCMRRSLWRRCWLNAIPANLVWLFGLLPWALCLVAASYRPGHSRAVLHGVTPEVAADREAAQQEVSWGRVFAILAVLCCWLPVIGLVFALAAFGLNRRVGGWLRTASLLALVVALLVHAAWLVLYIVSVALG